MKNIQLPQCFKQKNRDNANKKRDISEVSTVAQRQRLLAVLRAKPVTTIMARSELNILSPAPRIFELRALGYDIITYRRKDITAEGLPHSVAEYVLLSDNAGDDANG